MPAPLNQPALVSRETHPHLLQTPRDELNTAPPGSTEDEERFAQSAGSLARKIIALATFPIRLIHLAAIEARRTHRAHLALDWNERHPDAPNGAATRPLPNNRQGKSP